MQLTLHTFILAKSIADSHTNYDTQGNGLMKQLLSANHDPQHTLTKLLLILRYYHSVNIFSYFYNTSNNSRALHVNIFS